MDSCSSFDRETVHITKSKKLLLPNSIEVEIEFDARHSFVDLYFEREGILFYQDIDALDEKRDDNSILREAARKILINHIDDRHDDTEFALEIAESIQQYLNKT